MSLLHHLSGTSRALYRVFVAPPLTARVLPLLPSPPPTPHKALLPRTSLRTKAYKVKRQGIADYFVIDRQIKAPYINFIDENGEYHPNTPIRWVTYNPQESHLLLVQPGKTDEMGRYYPDALPVCKIISKVDLRAQLEKKLELERRQARGLGTGPLNKSLELNWAIGSGDLKHRLGKLREFLNEGRKVEVILEPKPARKGRQATMEECEALLKAIREEVDGIKGASEVREAEGVIGGSMLLVFQGQKLEKEEAQAANQLPGTPTGDPSEKQQETRQETKQERRLRKLAEREKAKAAAKNEANS